MKYIRYTAEEKEFLYEFIPGHTDKETQEEFSKRFRAIGRNNVEAFRKNHKIRTGRGIPFAKGHKTWNKGMSPKDYCSPEALARMAKTQFKPGRRTSKWREIGDERINVDGYIEIKVGDPKVWKLKHRYVWEQHYGPVPKGMIIMFRDGNRQNTDIDNLVMVDRATNARISHLGLHGCGALDSAIATAKLYGAIKERSRKK